MFDRTVTLKTAAQTLIPNCSAWTNSWTCGGWLWSYVTLSYNIFCLQRLAEEFAQPSITPHLPPHTHTLCDYERSTAVRAAPAESCNYGYVVRLAAGEGEQVIGRSRAFTAQVTTSVCVHLNTIDAVFTGERTNSWPCRPQSLCQDPTLLFAPINRSPATTKRIAVLLSLLTCWLPKDHPP